MSAFLKAAFAPSLGGRKPVTFYDPRQRVLTPSSRSAKETYGSGGDVRKIGSDARGVDDIVKSKFVDERRELQQQRQGLAEP
jgi:hypothetical protein